MPAPDIFRFVVITGASGLVGSTIAEALTARNNPFVGLEHHDCDITSAPSVAQMFARYSPSLLINCAAYARVDAAERETEMANAINGEALGILGAEAVKHKTTVVHFSSNYVFDGQIDRPYRPDDTPHPISAYGRSKLLGEQKLSQISHLNWLVVRTAGVFGRHGNCFPRTLLQRAHTTVPLKVVSDQLTSLTLADDLAVATFELISHGASGLWNVANRESVTWYNFARAVNEEFGLSNAIEPVSTEQRRRDHPGIAKRPLNGVLDVSLTETMLGCSLRTWRQALNFYRTLLTPAD